MDRPRSTPPPGAPQPIPADAARTRILRNAIRERRLQVVETAELDIIRRRAGKGFCYLDGTGSRITDRGIIARIRSLAIPPAYRDVRIASNPRAHLQAVGRDEADRLQYRYHPDWTEVREDWKAARLKSLIAALPEIRTTVRRDLAARRCSRAKAAACAVAIIDSTSIRVGGEAYARTDGGRGTATLLKQHVVISGATVELRFRGKGGTEISQTVSDRRLAHALKRLAALPGRRLLQFARADGRGRPITAADINAYLREVSGAGVTAKDLRSLGANVAALEALAALTPETSARGRRRQVAATMAAVAQQLANTPAVVRKSYVHRCLLDCFQRGALAELYRQASAGGERSRAENALARLFGA